MQGGGVIPALCSSPTSWLSCSLWKTVCRTDVLIWGFWDAPVIIGVLWVVSLLWYISLAAVTFQWWWSVAPTGYFLLCEHIGLCLLKTAREVLLQVGIWTKQAKLPISSHSVIDHWTDVSHSEWHEARENMLIQDEIHVLLCSGVRFFMQFIPENSSFEGLCRIFQHIAQAIAFSSKRSQHHDVSNQKNRTSDFFSYPWCWRQFPISSKQTQRLTLKNRAKSSLVFWHVTNPQ